MNFSRFDLINSSIYEEQVEPIPLEEQKKPKRYEYCDLHSFHVNSSKFWDCKSCKQHLCDYHFQNRRKHECILDQED